MIIMAACGNGGKWEMTNWAPCNFDPPIFKKIVTPTSLLDFSPIANVKKGIIMIQN